MVLSHHLVSFLSMIQLSSSLTCPLSLPRHHQHHGFYCMIQRSCRRLAVIPSTPFPLSLLRLVIKTHYQNKVASSKLIYPNTSLFHPAFPLTTAKKNNILAQKHKALKCEDAIQVYSKDQKIFTPHPITTAVHLKVLASFVSTPTGLGILFRRYQHPAFPSPHRHPPEILS